MKTTNQSMFSKKPAPNLLPTIRRSGARIVAVLACATWACSPTNNVDDVSDLGSGGLTSAGSGGHNDAHQNSGGSGAAIQTGGGGPQGSGGGAVSGGSNNPDGDDSGSVGNGSDTSSGASSSGGGGTGSGSATGSGGSEGNDCTGPQPDTHGTNPLFSNLFAADPAALVDNCTFYITAGHDQGTGGFDLREWYVLSSIDMVNWSDNGGPIMKLSTFKWANANAWAGQMVKRGSKFYWYVPVSETGGGMAIGVAVADSPLGPFTDALGKPLVNDAIEMSEFNYNDAGQTAYTIDPTVFIDDDGQAYLMYGGFGRLVVVLLNEDMISLSSMTENTPPGFFEAPYLTKREGVYYVVYAAGVNPATIDYVSATSPTGPWKNPGRILDALPNVPGQDAATSHPAITEFMGQWYLVYHLSNGPGGGTYKRQVAIEKLTFESNGTIKKVTSSAGLSF